MGRKHMLGVGVSVVVALASTAGCTAHQQQPAGVSSESVAARSTTPVSSRASAPERAPGAPIPLPAGVAEEASGLTPAGGGDSRFWTVDDATGADALIAIDQQGHHVGSLQVAEMSAGNAEALSSAPCTAGSAARCLFVGDLGDHVGRDDVLDHRLTGWPRS